MMLLAGLLGAGQPAGAGTVLQPGQSVTVSGEVLLPLTAAAGDYIAGRIDPGPVVFDADLVAADGSHLRRIAAGQAGAVSFRHLAGTATTLRLRAPGPVTVTLEAVVPVAEQLPPAEAYLSPRITALAAGLEAGGDTAGFWREAAASGTPLIEQAGEGEAILTFLWRGAQRNVRLFGGPSGDHDMLMRLGDSDVWYRSYRVPDDSRASYQLAPDVPDVPGDARARRVAILATAQADPLNRAPWPAGAPDVYAQDSTYALARAPAQPGTPPDPAADPRIERFEFDSLRLGNRREITLSMPKDLDPADPRIVVALIFDGERALAEIEAPRVLDTLTRQGRLPPVVAVLIPSLGSETRAVELPGNRAFADVLADEVLPQVLTRLGIAPDPARTVLAGASYGGLGAATIAMRRPDVFGNVLSMSGSFWWAPKGKETDGTPWVAAEIAARDRLPLRFFLSAGRFERGRDGTAGIWETSRELRDVLRLRGYEVYWQGYSGGHDYYVWRGALADGLIALFGNRLARQGCGHGL